MRLIKKFFLFLFVLCFNVNSGFAQTKFSAEQLQYDLDYLFNKLEYIHPNLYAYTPKDEIDQTISSIKSEIRDSMNSFDFWLRVSPIVNNLHHGHTGITPQNSEVNKYISELQKAGFSYFPFSIIIIDSSFYVHDIYSDTKDIERGNKVIAINGINASDILYKLVNFENGERMEYRLYYVERGFIWNYPLIYPNSKYKVVYMNKGVEKTILLNGISEQETDEYSAKVFSVYKRNYRFKIVENNIARIEYNQCVDYDNFKLFLDSVFTTIKHDKISNLIIDIRKNEGGDSRLNALLLTYLTDKPFYECSKHIEKLTSDIRTTNEYYSQFNKDTILKLTKYQYYENKPENPLSFKGKVFLLTGIATFSSGTELAMLIKDYKLGEIIGQETGGIPTGYGDRFNFELPNTKTKVSVSYKWSLRPSGVDDNRGVIPDIILKPSLQNLLSEKDFEMDYALNLIKNNKTLR
jgi:peptidase S41-like protein